MKTVSIFQYNAVAGNIDELREKLKRQYDEGLVLVDERLEYLGTIAVHSLRAEIKTAEKGMETETGGGLKLTRRMSETVSLAELKKAIASGRGPEFIRPFDELEFTLDTGETVTAVCGGYITPTRARFVFKDALADAPMNEEATNEGGYYKSAGRKRVLEEVYPHLPPELRAIIEPRSIVETIDGERVEYADPLWLPSGTDVFGPRDNWYAPEPDSEQLEIFKTERGRVKERNGETVYWWLRSPIASNSYAFVNVHTGGAVYYGGAYCSLAFAPGFDL